MSYKRLLLLAVAGLGLSACGQNDYRPTADATAETMFAEACESCHGVAGEGKFGFLLKIAGSQHPVEELASKITNGGHVMPAFPNIDPAQTTALAQYIQGKQQ